MYGQKDLSTIGLASPALMAVLEASWWVMTIITLLFVGSALLQLVRPGRAVRP